MAPGGRAVTVGKPRAAFFDCFSGASGDMVLGALLDAGLPEDRLRAELAKLDLSGYRIEVQRVARSGLAGTQVRVRLEDRRPRERSLSDIEAIIGRSALSQPARERIQEVFRRLARVEAKVHGVAVDQVHFHEVGAIDAIVDIAGAVIGLELLGVDSVYCSPLPLGRGSVKAAHGVLPLPAPATLELIAEVAAPTRPVDIAAELVTPTGAAILTTMARFAQPPIAIDTVGTGFGARELPWPNVLRVWLGEAVESGLETGEVTVIETNLDDCTPEQAGFAMERLFEAGALDVFFTPVQMKKNRPGVLLTVLAAPARSHEIARVVLRETTSLGVRFRTSQRLMCPRRSETIETRFGPIQVKIKSIDGVDVVCPEYEECARVARERGIPLSEAYAAVLSHAHS